MLNNVNWHIFRAYRLSRFELLENIPGCKTELTQLEVRPSLYRPVVGLEKAYSDTTIFSEHIRFPRCTRHSVKNNVPLWVQPTGDTQHIRIRGGEFSPRNFHATQKSDLPPRMCMCWVSPWGVQPRILCENLLKWCWRRALKQRTLIW